MDGFSSLIEQHKNRQDSYITDKIDEARQKAYAGATSGIILGPIGLLIAYAIAAGVTEGEIVPKLVKELEDFKGQMDGYKGDFSKLKDGAQGMANFAHEERGRVSDFKIALENTDSKLGNVRYQELEPLFQLLMKSVQNLVVACEKYLLIEDKTVT